MYISPRIRMNAAEARLSSTGSLRYREVPVNTSAWREDGRHLLCYFWPENLEMFNPLVWFYHAFGLVSIRDTGRNAYLIILARSCRMFAYGTNSLVLALFFAELKFSDYHIGLFMTLTLLGDVVLGLLLTLIADRYGRRKILFGGSFLMVLSGAAFAIFENFWILLGAAIVGVVSATGGDFGPFRAIEESVLSQLTSPKTRADVLAWYVTLSTVGSAIGSEAGGRMIHGLTGLNDWSLVDAYHAIFWVYTAMGFVNALLVWFLTSACELQGSANAEYARVAQDECESVELSPRESEDVQRPIAQEDGESRTTRENAEKPKRRWTNALSQVSKISRPTRSVMYKLWFLLGVDSIADGMVPYTLTNYYMDVKFHPSKSLLGDATSASYFLGAISAVFAGPLARKIGLINTMVFTHVPSSAAVLLFGLPNALPLCIFLLLVRAGLNNMDQAPRSAFVAAVVKPDERTAVMGITNLLRTLAAMAGPSITGVLAGQDQFWVAFVVAGAFRLAYDLGLWLMFVNMKLYEHESGAAECSRPADEDIAELSRTSTTESLASSGSSGDETDGTKLSK